MVEFNKNEKKITMKFESELQEHTWGQKLILLR